MKRVLVIGGGAAGAGCCFALGRFPEKVYVECWDEQNQPGGFATFFFRILFRCLLFRVAQNVLLPSGEDINDGVQGGSPAYANTQLLHSLLGFSTNQVEMTIRLFNH